jgi:hypothetical protein
MNIETINKKVWLTQKEAEVYTSFWEKTLTRFRLEGTDTVKKHKLPYRRVGGKIIFSRKEIDEFFNKHKVTVHGQL